MAVAVWNPSAFIVQYPALTAAVAAQPATFAQLFVMAGLYLNNTDCSPVQDVALRAILLNMLTAHQADINGLLTADGQPKPVGIVSQAAEGAVSASFLNATPTQGSPAWFQQTQYGSAYWQATERYRSARYIGPIRRRIGWAPNGFWR